MRSTDYNSNRRRSCGALSSVACVLLCLLAKEVSCFQPLQKSKSRRIADPVRRIEVSYNICGEFPLSPFSYLLSSVIDNQNSDSEEDLSSILALSLDPATEAAKTICLDALKLTGEQYEQVLQLTTAVCGWNEKLNLVSRKDCSEATVFARHVLPSLAYCNNTAAGNHLLCFTPNARVMDVGTGGGFPGLPLAIQYPDCHFVLADSVGKKVAAVAEMAATLQLTNVETYHGRVENYFDDDQTGVVVAVAEKFDVVTGRSVTALPQFCAWVQHLLKPESGHLIYWIGGEVDPAILQLAVDKTAIRERIPTWKDDFDKQMLVFTAAAVKQIAASSGVVVTPTKRSNAFVTRRREAKDGKRPKGAWQKKNDGPRQRGYENFQRYSSTSGSSSSAPLE